MNKLRPLKRVLVVKKTSRYEWEKKRLCPRSEEDLRAKLTVQGLDYIGLLHRHEQQENSIERICQRLRDNGVDVAVQARKFFNEDHLEWANLVIAAGGDGNFLATASKIRSPEKILIGINTDPHRSEGFLCSRPTPSLTIDDIVDKVVKGRFQTFPRHRISVNAGDTELPVLALNEAFLGEKDPSHTSLHEQSCDGGNTEMHKSSGLLVYSGTGSTSWAYNAYKLSAEHVSAVLRIARQKGMVSSPSSVSEEDAEQIANTFNKSRVFPGDELRMGYVVREPILRGIFATSRPSGYCRRLVVKSISWLEPQLITDGIEPIVLPNGCTTIFSMDPKNALMSAIVK